MIAAGAGFDIARHQNVCYNEKYEPCGEVMRTFAILIGALLLTAGHSYGRSPEWYEAKYDSIAKPDFDHCRKLKVSNLTFECDRAKFVLDAGELYFFPPVDEQVYGCFFNGKARIILDPPTEVERFSAKKYLRTETIDHKFLRFRMMASPDLLAEFFDMSAAEESKLPGKLRSFVKRSKSASKKEYLNLEAAVLMELAGQAGTFLWIDFDSKSRRYAFAYDNRETESTRLYVRTAMFGGDFYEPVISVFPKEHYDSGKSWKHRDPVRLVTPLKYDIDAEISERAHLACRVKLDFVSNMDSLLSLYALIFYKTDIDSVLDGDGRNLYFSKLKEEPGFSVFLHDPLFQGDTTSLTFFYRSKDFISKTLTGDFFISSQINWYPILEYLKPTLFDVSFTCPRQLSVLSVGKRVADSISGNLRFTRWVTDAPEIFTSFNYGLFDTLTLNKDDLPTVKIFRGKSHKGGIFGPDMKKKVGEDVIGALQLFTHVYGDMPCDQLLVTEIPSRHGQGMPGLLHLARSTFQSEEPVWDALFRAHEVAHQWWGHTVRWESYHDQWISEAMSDFSGAWYVQTKYEEDKKYFEVLDKWRSDVVEKGTTGTRLRGSWTVGTEAGPIWLGYRLVSSKSSDFGTLLYSKGAYVIHMIRCMMKDWVTGSDERFIEMMRDFVRIYYRKTATTGDFQRIVEKHIGEPMGWFFDQWIYDIHVPKFKFQKTIREEGGKYYVDVEIIQKEVPDDFKSIIPIRIKLPDDMWTVVTVTAVGERTQITLPPFPHKPEKFDFNYYEAVLAR